MGLEKWPIFTRIVVIPLPTSSIFTPSVQPKFSEWLHKQISPEWILYPQKVFCNTTGLFAFTGNLKTALATPFSHAWRFLQPPLVRW